MKTPLFFKLLLLLALGFRLIKAAQKSKTQVQIPLALADGPLTGWGVNPPSSLTDLEKIKWLYRKQVRSLPWEQMTAAQQGVWLLHAWQAQRESTFRWLWYRPECALAWGGLLARLEWTEAAQTWMTLLREVSGKDAPEFPEEWIPQADKSYPSLETFQQIISSESIYSKLLTYVILD